MVCDLYHCMKIKELGSSSLSLSCLVFEPLPVTVNLRRSSVDTDGKSMEACDLF